MPWPFRYALILPTLAVGLLWLLLTRTSPSIYAELWSLWWHGVLWLGLGLGLLWGLVGGRR